MTHASSNLSASEVQCTPVPVEFSSAQEINRSCAAPVLLFFVSALAWLVLGSLLALLTSVKLHGPEFLGNCSLLTYGRLHAAQNSLFLYGFAMPASLGVAFWLLCRLGRNVLVAPILVAVGIMLWNVGVLAGLVGILAGDSTGFDWLQMPVYSSAILFGSYCLIGVLAVLTYSSRKQRELYPSQWFILAALFIFPWIFSTANLLLVVCPVRGVVQAVINGWYINAFNNLWLTSMGVAAIFYFIPVLKNVPLYSRSLALSAFWFLFVIGGWGGVAAGTPVPAWITSLSVVAAVLMIVPVVAVIINWRLTILSAKESDESKKSISICFMNVSAILLLVSGILTALNALPVVSDATRFTFFSEALTQLSLYGFFAMAMLGAIIHIVPQLLSREWHCSSKLKVTFWMGLVGTLIYSIAFIISGIVQSKLFASDLPFLAISKKLLPFVGFSTIGLLLLIAANGLIFLNLLRTIASCCCACICKDKKPEVRS